MKPGLDILNCGSGHTEIHLDGSPEETERAKAMILDMMKRGYGLFITDDAGTLTRVESFDPAKLVYIVADLPRDLAVPSAASPPPARRRGRAAKATKEVPMQDVRVTAIAKTAGG